MPINQISAALVNRTPQQWVELVEKAMRDVTEFCGHAEFAQLSKTEKTIVGTRVETLLRAWPEIKPSVKLDAEIGGVECDIKFSLTSQWMIPVECQERPALLIGLTRHGSVCVGLLECRLDRLNPGQNRDLKKTISKAGKREIHWLVA